MGALHGGEREVGGGYVRATEGQPGGAQVTQWAADRSGPDSHSSGGWLAQIGSALTGSWRKPAHTGAGGS